MSLVKNMGLRYTCFRVQHEVQKRVGLLESKYPVQPPRKTYTTLESWKEQAGVFFFESKEALKINKCRQPELQEKYDEYKKGNFLLFNSKYYHLGTKYDWVTNPETFYKYDSKAHWTKIADYSKSAGDIKFVWEKSRFSFLYDLIRFDYHFEKDCAELVFDEIISWINSNPVNCGPNYRCSQEISLRVLNWTFALYYYKNSPHLTSEVFDSIQYAIYWQMHHVYHNINFSRIAVRNNHAITETLALYLVSLLYPGIPEFRTWGTKGKKWFEQEVAYQVYEDGTFLQFSMNYHRVVIQLLTWGIRLAELNNAKFSEVVYDRARKSARFLRICMDDSSGWLPNYGSNDGALFFKLNDCDYRDYRGSLAALGNLLNEDLGIEDVCEDGAWYGIQKSTVNSIDLNKTVYSFAIGGYYIIRENDTLTFIRCGNHKDRPAQADNLHLDIWYKGKNVLVDGGSYKYNTTNEELKYFMGTGSHNSVMLDDHDQMRKGSRFIWYNWTQCTAASLNVADNVVIFDGTIKAFGQIDKNVRHTRRIKKTLGKAEWQVTDEIVDFPPSATLKQLWHVAPDCTCAIDFRSHNGEGDLIKEEESQAWQSDYYGAKIKNKQLVFASQNPIIHTVINIS